MPDEWVWGCLCNLESINPAASAWHRFALFTTLDNMGACTWTKKKCVADFFLFLLRLPRQPTWVLVWLGLSVDGVWLLLWLAGVHHCDQLSSLSIGTSALTWEWRIVQAQSSTDDFSVLTDEIEYFPKEWTRCQYKMLMLFYCRSFQERMNNHTCF